MTKFFLVKVDFTFFAHIVSLDTAEIYKYPNTDTTLFEIIKKNEFETKTQLSFFSLATFAIFILVHSTFFLVLWKLPHMYISSIMKNYKLRKTQDKYFLMLFLDIIYFVPQSFQVLNFWTAPPQIGYLLDAKCQMLAKSVEKLPVSFWKMKGK